MQFDPNNPIIKLCAQGMEMEGAGNNEEALKLFKQAWDESASNFEKFTSAHYIARHQESVAEKLEWDKTALMLAQEIDNAGIEGAYPSLYLNIAKCYEDLGEISLALENYNRANSYTGFLLDDGYGKMIRGGIISGIERVSNR